MCIKRFSVVVAMLFVLPTMVWAQIPQVKPDHPSSYIVVKGDTLWDISGRFLQEPWLWPQVWEINPHIQNPHLIYPGDEIVLDFRDGVPRIRLSRRGLGSRTVKLSPTARAMPLNTAIPTIPIDEIHQFLSRPRVVTERDIDQAPYVVSAGRESLMGAPGEKIFARGLGKDAPDRFAVYRRGQEYRSESGELIGLEAIHIGDALLLEGGDPATLLLTSTTREVLVGDRLYAVGAQDIDTHFSPRAPEQETNGQIVAVFDGVSQIGQYQIVVLDRGEKHGVAPGHVLSVFQRGETIVDPLAKPPAGDQTVGRKHLELDPKRQGGMQGALVSMDDYVVNLFNRFKGLGLGEAQGAEDWRLVKLPDERAGTVMVFRSFENLSYALVMEATRAMHVYDGLRNP